MKHFKLFFALFAMLALGTTNAWGAEETELFSQTYPGSPTKFTSAYDSSFSLTTNDYTLVYANVNNGNKTDNWTAVRAGSKNNASVATITSGKIEAAISKVMINFTQVANKNTNSLYLEVSNNSSFTSATKITATIATGNIEFTIATPLANQYYRITIDQAKGSANGFNRFDKIVFYQAVSSGDDEPSTPTPSVTLDPSSKDFGTINVGETPSQEFTITTENTTATLTASIDNTTDYAVSAIEGDKVTVTYQPQSAGTHSAVLTVKAGEEATATVNLTGKAVQALEGTWILVTDASSLKAGDEIIIAAKETDVALSTTQNNNNRGEVAITKNSNTITATSEAQVLTLQAGTKEGTLALSTGAGYLYAASSGSNYLRTETTLSDNSSWSIAVAADGTATLIAQGTNTKNTLYYNKNSKIFSCYSTAQQEIAIYKNTNGQQVAGLAYETTKYLTKLGETFVTPVLANPNSVDVTYESSDNNVATVAADGAVTINAAGIATITASFAGNSSFLEGSAKYTICVTEHAGTEADPYTVADARRVIDVMETAEGVYANGIVSKIVTAYNEQYGNISYNISADGLTTSDQLQAYRGKSYDGANFTSPDDVKVGDEVVIKGTLKKYSTTYEFDENNQLVTLKRDKQQPGLAYAETEHTANVGEDFAEPELTNPNGLSVEYSTSDATLATVNASTGDVTIGSKAGTVTITASFAGNENYVAGEASYTITITDPALAIATLPFEFNGGLNDIVSTAGITQEGLGSDYTSDNAQNSKLKFDHTGDYIIIHFDTKPDKLMYNIKNNDFEDGTFSVQESVDGEIYSTLCTYHKTFTNAPSALHTLQATSRYVKFIYTEKVRGNVGLGNIQITKLDTRQEAGLEWSTTSYNTYDGDETLAPTLTNPYGLNITYSSSNEDVATIDGAGKLTLKNTGITTITATFAGNENYKEAEVSYTLSYASKWALTYTSNVKVGTNIVKINDTEYEAIKTGTGSAYGSTTVVVPVSTHTLHFHAAGWGNDEDVKLIVKNGETELGTFILSKDAGVKENSPYTLQGTPYLQYYSVALTNITTETEITFEASTSGEGKRFVLYGVNQEGGVLPELNRIEIAGEATELTYEVGDVFNPAGLSVNAIYTLAGVDHETVAIDAEDVEWSFNPATIAAETSQVEVTATYEGKTATTTITGLTVNAQTPEITVSPTSIDWGTVAKDSEASREVSVTLKAVANATISISGTNPSTFSVDKTALTETGTIVVSANTSSVGTFTATLTISDDAAAAEEKKISLKIIVEGIDDVYGNWQLVTDASTLKAGDMVIVASVEVEEKYYTMGKQNSNNRAAIESTVSETQLTPTTGTSVLTLVDAGDGKFAFQASNGKYLSAAGTGTSNYLREAENYDSDKTKWTISVTAEGIATIKATSDNRNWMRYNPNNGSPIFSCYGTGQTDIALYKRVPDYTRTGLSQGAYGTICLSNNIEALFGATLYTVAGKETNGRVVFDEVPISETEAGKPYIFLAESSHIEVYYGTETATEAGKHNSLQGTFTQIAPAEDNILVGNYMVVNNVIKKCGAWCGLGANRAYFTTELESLGTAPAQMPGRRRVSMGMTGENGTTDLDNITTTDTPVKVIENGQLIIIRDGVKYNVQGQKL